jgi:hypothetical protein
MADPFATNSIVAKLWHEPDGQVEPAPIRHEGVQLFVLVEGLWRHVSDGAQSARMLHEWPTPPVPAGPHSVAPGTVPST